MFFDINDNFLGSTFQYYQNIGFFAMFCQEDGKINENFDN